MSLLWWSTFGSGTGQPPAITPIAGIPTFTDLFTDALMRLRVQRAGEVMDGDSAAYMLFLFNSILDEWNSDRRAVYNENFFEFTLTPNANPHTIGPATSLADGTNPNFVVDLRPVALRAASINLGGSPGVYTPLTVRDDRWYSSQSVPGLTQTFPTDVYYSPEWNDPNDIGAGYGSMYFWGVPQVAYTVRLWMRVLLSRVADPTLIFSMPPGYYEALTLTLAKKAAPAFGQSFSATLADDLRIAIERVFGNNDEIPRLATADSGLQRGQSGSFNYLNRGYFS